MSEWNMYGTLSEGKHNEKNNRVPFCTLYSSIPGTTTAVSIQVYTLVIRYSSSKTRS